MSRVRVSRIKAMDLGSSVRVRVSRISVSSGAVGGTTRVRVSRLSANASTTGPVANAGPDVTSDALMLVTLSSAASTGSPTSVTWSVEEVTVGTLADVDAAQLGTNAYVRTPAHWDNQTIIMKLLVSSAGGSSSDTVRINVIAHDRFYSTAAGQMRPLARRSAAAFPAGAVLI